VKRVGVIPPRERGLRRRLFDALAAAFEVEVVAGLDGADAAVAIGVEPPPSLPGVAFLDTGGRGAGLVDLSETSLRRRRLADDRADGPALPTGPGDVVVAACRGRAVLVRRGRSYRAAVAPAELGATESLRDRFVVSQFLGLLPLVELLRGQAPVPAVGACFVLDDPNLHAARYGHVDFAALAAHAAAHGYHVTVATVPADAWFASARAVRAFGPTLSLTVHGNAHRAHELARPRTAAAREALVAQAVRRIERFEARTGLAVARVMVAPHEECSAEMMETLARSDFEALCNGLGERSEERLLADWLPLDLRAGGLPVLSRRPLAAPRDELALRAYLGQPIVLGLHHGDLAAGLDVLAEAAAEIDALAAPAWQGAGEIVRRCVTTRRDGATLVVRPYGRRFVVDVPADVADVTVELPVTHPEPAAEQILLDERSGTRLTGRLRRRDAFDAHAVSAPHPSPAARTRRLLVESRDRLQGAWPR
jgi:hypothetical protein